eukprot:scaffold2068_cov96-Cylindrotheca_fusiformis.AAC.24
MDGPIPIVSVVSIDENDKHDDESLSCSSPPQEQQTQGQEVQQQQSRDEGRRVRFSADVTFFPCIARGDFSPQELQACFYTSKEKKQQWVHQNKAVTRSEQGKEEDCRGLESLTDKGYRIMTLAKNKCVDAVMDEQEEQWREGITCLERIAMASMQVSKASIIMARKIAKRDAQKANKAYRQMDKEQANDDEEDTEETASLSSLSAMSTTTASDEQSTRSTGLNTAGTKINTAIISSSCAAIGAAPILLKTSPTPTVE